MVVVMRALRLLGTITYTLFCWTLNAALATGVVLAFMWVMFLWRPS